MNIKQKTELLKDIVRAVDHDIYEGIFEEWAIEEPEQAEETIENLMGILREYGL
jgi:hypothetical protein|tara:strand:+ start:41 stop:202 length:162 start_codon:yes stop_codon:yes gene_type:complete